MKIFGKRIGVTKTKNIPSGDYKDRAEKLKKLEENLVKTVEKYSDYAKTVNKDKSLQEITETANNINNIINIIEIEVEIFKKEKQLIREKKIQKLFNNFFKKLSEYQETLNLNLNKEDFETINDYITIITTELAKIAENLESYNKELTNFKKEKAKMSSNKYRNDFINNSRKTHDTFNAHKAVITASADHIKKLINNKLLYENKKKNIIDIIDNILNNIEQLSFKSFELEYEKYTKDNNSFKDKCIETLEQEYKNVKAKFEEFSQNDIVILNSEIINLEKINTDKEKILEILSDVKSNKLKLSDAMKKLKKECGTAGQDIVSCTNNLNQKLKQEEQAESKILEDELLSKFEDNKIKEIVKSKIKKSKINNPKTECKSRQSIETINQKIQSLNQRLKTAKENHKKCPENKIDSSLSELLDYNTSNELLRIDNMDKSKFKNYCEKISSNKKELIAEAKVAQKTAKKAKQTIKDIYDLENKVSKLDESKKKKEIDRINAKIIGFKEAYNVKIQELSEFSTIIGDLKIVDVDKLQL